MTVDRQSCPTCSLIPGGSLPRKKEPAGQFPIPTAEVHWRAGRFRPTCPGFNWRPSVQMLMRPCVVVPATKRRELGVQIIAIDNRDAIKPLLQRPEEPLDPPVLPRTVRLDALQPNAEHSERGPHCRRDEAGFVVDANPSWHTLPTNRFDHRTTVVRMIAIDGDVIAAAARVSTACVRDRRACSVTPTGRSRIGWWSPRCMGLFWYFAYPGAAENQLPEVSRKIPRKCLFPTLRG